MGLTEDLQTIKHRISEMERSRARREADIEAAERHRDEALQTLQKEYGVNTIAQARKLAAKLEAEVEQEVAAALSSLERVE